MCDEKNEFCSECNVEGFSFGVVDDNGKITDCVMSCPPDTFQKEVEGKKYCVKDCGDGYYKKEDNSCHPCGSGCDECESDTKCTTCKGGYIKNGDNCEKCDEKCATCSGTKDKCQTCTSGYMPVYDRNSDLTDCAKDTCPDGTYKDGGNSCYPCSENCKVCESETKCTTCKESYFKNGDKCDKCSDNCMTCTGKVKCTGCAAGFILVYDYQNDITECLQGTKCEDGYYKNEADNTCYPCSDKCVKCSGAADYCTECVVGKFVNNGKCDACDPKCGKCEGSSSNCISCSNTTIPFFEYESSTTISDCLEKCDGNRYSKDNKCYPCDSTCKTCNDSLKCETCETNQFINSDDKCEDCDGKCLTCSGCYQMHTVCK